ncbi:MAG: hypothetical protein HOO85_03970 [Methylotenera sp.]|nr:hypothetical protein [Methylotenera sp.]
MAESSFKVLGRAESQQYTPAQAKAVYDSGIWEGMSDLRRAQFQASQELQVMPAEVFAAAVEKITGQPLPAVNAENYLSLKADILATVEHPEALSANRTTFLKEFYAEYGERLAEKGYFNVQAKALSVLTEDEAQAFKKHGSWQAMPDIDKVSMQRMNVWAVIDEKEYNAAVAKVLSTVGKPSAFYRPTVEVHKDLDELAAKARGPLSKTIAVTESLENTVATVSNVAAEELSVLSRLGKFFGGKLAIASAIAQPLYVMADYKDAVERAKPYVESGKLSAEAARDYADAVATTNLINNATLNVDPALGAKYYAQWIATHDISKEIYTELDVSGVVKYLIDDRIAELS